VRVGGDVEHKQMIETSGLRAHVVFSRESPPTLLTFAALIMIMHDESRKYRLLSVSLIRVGCLSWAPVFTFSVGELLFLCISYSRDTYGTL
jgi:hypothetical protein